MGENRQNTQSGGFPTTLFSVMAAGGRSRNGKYRRIGRSHGSTIEQVVRWLFFLLFLWGASLPIYTYYIYPLYFYFNKTIFSISTFDFHEAKNTVLQSYSSLHSSVDVTVLPARDESDECVDVFAVTKGQLSELHSKVRVKKSFVKKFKLDPKTSMQDVVMQEPSDQFDVVDISATYSTESSGWLSSASLEMFIVEGHEQPTYYNVKNKKGVFYSSFEKRLYEGHIAASSYECKQNGLLTFIVLVTNLYPLDLTVNYTISAKTYDTSNLQHSCCASKKESCSLPLSTGNNMIILKGEVTNTSPSTSSKTALFCER